MKGLFCLQLSLVDFMSIYTVWGMGDVHRNRELICVFTYY